MFMKKKTILEKIRLMWKILISYLIIKIHILCLNDYELKFCKFACTAINCRLMLTFRVVVEQSSDGLLTCQLVQLVYVLLAWVVLRSNRTNSKVKACDISAPGAGAKLVTSQKSKRGAADGGSQPPPLFILLVS